MLRIFRIFMLAVALLLTDCQGSLLPVCTISSATISSLKIGISPDSKCQVNALSSLVLKDGLGVALLNITYCNCSGKNTPVSVTEYCQGGNNPVLCLTLSLLPQCVVNKQLYRCQSEEKTTITTPTESSTSRFTASNPTTKTSTASTTTKTSTASSPTTKTSTPSSPTTKTSTPSSPTTKTSTPSSPTTKTSTPSSPTTKTSTPSSSTTKTSTPSSPTTKTSTVSSSTTQVDNPCSNDRQEVVGCYDNELVRVLPVFKETSKDMTLDRCSTLCREDDYTFAGVDGGTSCFCGDAGFESYGKVECEPTREGVIKIVWVCPFGYYGQYCEYICAPECQYGCFVDTGSCRC